MEDHVMPQFFQELARLLPDHMARNERVMKLLAQAHDDMVTTDEAQVLLRVYRRFIEVLLTANPDPTLTERVKDAFVQAATDMGSTLATATGSPVV